MNVTTGSYELCEVAQAAHDGTACGRNPYGDRVVLEARDGKLGLFGLACTEATLGMRTCGTVELDAHVLEPGSVVVEARKLAEALRGDKGTCHINQEGEAGLLNVAAGHRVVTLEPGSGYHERPEWLGDEGAVAALAVDAREFKEALKGAAAYADNERAGKTLCFVSMEARGKELRLVSMDGCRLYIRDLKAEGDGDAMAAMVAPVPLLKWLRYVKARRSDPVKVEFFRGHVRFTYRGMRVDSEAFAGGTYPNYRGVVPKEHRLHAAIPRTELEAFVAGVIPTARRARANGHMKPVVLELRDGVLDMGYQYQYDAMHDSVDVAMVGEGMRVGFDPFFLESLLKNFAPGEEFLETYFLNPDSPMVVTNGRETHLLLPVHL